MTIIELHRATPAPDCECHRTGFNCRQGRECPERTGAQGASACSELLEDDEALERRFRIRAWFWNLYCAIVLVGLCALIAHLLPALKALFPN